MKKIIFLPFFLVFLALASCDKKKDEITISEELPSWIKQKVEDLTSNGESCKFVDVILFEVDGRKYYNIDFGYSDCGFCNVFDEKGRKISQQNLLTGEKKVLELYPGCE